VGWSSAKARVVHSVQPHSTARDVELHGHTTLEFAVLDAQVSLKGQVKFEGKIAVGAGAGAAVGEAVGEDVGKS